MSQLTDFLILEIKPLCNNFFAKHSHEYNLRTNEGCGTYTEGLVEYLRTLGYEKVGFLKKTGSGTQYNGHSHDGFLYREGDPSLYRHVDCIVNAESTDPNLIPAAGFGIDIPRYTDADWFATPNDNTNPVGMVPYVPYNENGFQRLKNMLAHDYGRRPQNADFDVSIWAGRYFHNCYMGPEGIPLGEDGALHRIKPELCAALGIPVDNYYGE